MFKLVLRKGNYKRVEVDVSYATKRLYFVDNKPCSFKEFKLHTDIASDNKKTCWHKITTDNYGRQVLSLITDRSKLLKI